jgi:tetratricopeptide (TPR) repeat protein
MDEPQIPGTEALRAAAIEGLQATAHAWDEAGRYEEIVQLVHAWEVALQRSAPEDTIARAEVGVTGAWALFKTGDLHAAERALWMTEVLNQKSLERVRTLARETPGEESAIRLERAERVAGTVANHFGVLYLTLGDSFRARESLLSALELRNHGPHELMLRAQTLANLASAERQMGLLDEARVHIVEAGQILEKTPSLAGSDEYCLIVDSLAAIEQALGNENESERYSRAALELAQSRDMNVTLLGDMQSALGVRLLIWGSPMEAETHLRQALSAFDRSVGLEDAAVVDPMLALGHTLWSRDRIDEAIVMLDRAGQIGDVRLRHRLEIGDEEHRILAAVQDRAGLDLCLSMAWFHPDHPAVSTAAMDAVMRRKALATEVLAEQRRQQHAHELAPVGKMLRDLDSLREKLSEALLSGKSELLVQELTNRVRRAEELAGVLQRLDSTPREPEEREQPEYRRMLSRMVRPSEGLVPPAIARAM